MIWVLIWLFVPGGRFLSHPVALVVTIPFAIWFAFIMEGYYGKDASKIVIDEVVGMQVTLFMIQPDWKVGVAGFFLFRLFDIAKPFPVGRSERLRGGFGVVTDDFLAGVYSYAALYLLKRFTDFI
jgi:phosphatidylglycerophosphatase A